jgi:ABC-2 type transport system permease protein
VSVASATAGRGDVLGRILHDQRRPLAWWSLGVVGSILLYAAFWPSIRDNASQFQGYLEKLPDAVRNMLGTNDFTTPTGYVASEVFAFVQPVLLLVYAIGAGARAIAGEEEDGTLDLLLSTPIRRHQVLHDALLAMLACCLWLEALVWLSVAVFGAAFGLRVPLGNLAAAVLDLWGLGVAFGAIALAVGAATGSRRTALGASAGLALLTYVVNALAPTVRSLAPLRFLSPFHYSAGHTPLERGLTWSDPLVLLGIAIAASVVATLAFERRDLAA